MGRGRAPCCDKNQVKRGPWSPAEDLRLISFIQKHGHENWRALPKQAGLSRCGKSCRLRWINYLRPDVKRGNFTIQEEDTIIELHQSFGNKWSKIASHLPGRTDNEIKNVWNTHLKKRLALKKDTDINSNGDETKEFSISISSSSSSSSTSNSIMSCSKGNIEMAKNEMMVKEKLQDSSNGMSLIKNPKEITSSSPNSSDGSRQEEQMASVFNYRDVHDTLQEVNKPDSSNKKCLEIPLESDIDFWDMLDNLCPFQSNEVLQAEAEAWHSSNFGEKYCSREVENRKQLRYLESELGLEAENQENLGQDEAETQMVPEIDPAMAYFQMWPFWPQNSAV